MQALKSSDDSATATRESPFPSSSSKTARKQIPCNLCVQHFESYESFDLWTQRPPCIRYSTVVHSMGTPDIPKMAPGHRDYGLYSDLMARELPSLTGILISCRCKRSKGTHKARAVGQLGKTEAMLFSLHVR